MDIESMISAIIVAVIGLAITAVVLSKAANTAGVIGASGTALGGLVTAAVAPVTATSGTPFPKL